MPKKHNTPEIRDAVGALDFANVAVSDIVERLAEGQAGLPYPVKISARQVYYYRSAYRAEHGLPSRETATDPTGDSFAAIRARLLALISREVTVLERRRPGKMTATDLTMCKRLHATMHEWERKEHTATGRLRQSQVGPKDRPQKPTEPESAIQRLAREEREAKAAAPQETLEQKAHRLADELSVQSGEREAGTA